MSSAIVLDGELKSALCAVRQLGKKGVRVTVASAEVYAPAFVSRHTKETFVYTSPKVDQIAFVSELIAHAKQCAEKPALFSFSDATYLTIARHREQLAEHFALHLPSESAVETAFSKQKTYALARELGVSTIKELSIEDVTNFPVIVKPAHTVSWQGGSGHFGTAEFMFSHDVLLSRYHEIERLTGESPVVQECLTGDEHGVELLMHEGQVLAEFAHTRVRSQSPRGGASTVKETAVPGEVTDSMCTFAKALAKELHWSGPMMVEFKIDDRTGEAKLMEINGRYWGSLPLADYAGVPFVLLEYQLLQGEQVTPPVMQQKRTQHFLGDVRWLMQVFLKNDPLRKQLYPSRIVALLSFAFDTIFTKGDIFSWSDPWPVLAEYRYLYKKLRN